MTVFEYHDAGTTDARQKAALAYLLAQSSPGKAATGVLSGLAVSQTTTASTGVTIASGAGVAQAAVIDGASVLVNDTATTIDVLTANPVAAVPRNDLVILDSATNALRVIIGTPNATPADPTVPTTAVPLARLRHTANATTIPNSRIDDLRRFTHVGGNGPWAMATGRYSAPAIDPGQIAGPFRQDFPVGRFTVVPSLTFGTITGSRVIGYASAIDATGFNLYIRNVAASQSPAGGDMITWQAVQMTPVSADG